MASYKELIQDLYKRLLDLYLKKGKIDLDIYNDLKELLTHYEKVSDIIDLYDKFPLLFRFFRKAKKLDAARVLLFNDLKVMAYNINLLYAS